jgi:hypothetical protein
LGAGARLRSGCSARLGWDGSNQIGLSVGVDLDVMIVIDSGWSTTRVVADNSGGAVVAWGCGDLLGGGMPGCSTGGQL